MELIRGCPNASVEEIDMQLNEPDPDYDDCIVHISAVNESE